MTENLITMCSGFYYYYYLFYFFNWAILWSSETNDHLQEDLAEFIKPDYESRKFE
jgi:hypothetical protein